jgi:hypothetical protein
LQIDNGQTRDVSEDDRDQYGVCKLTLASSPGNQQDFQGVFRREVPVYDHQPNDPGCEVSEGTPTRPNIKKMWCSLNNQNLRVEKNGDFYTVSFPMLGKRVGVPVVARPFQQKWLDLIIEGGGQARNSEALQEEA